MGYANLKQILSGIIPGGSNGTPVARLSNVSVYEKFGGIRGSRVPANKISVQRPQCENEAGLHILC